MKQKWFLVFELA